MDSVNADSIDINLDDDVLDESIEDDSLMLQAKLNGTNGNHDELLMENSGNPVSFYL